MKKKETMKMSKRIATQIVKLAESGASIKWTPF